MTKFPAVLKRVAGDENGATMVEYGLMLAFIFVVCVVAVRAVGSGTKGLFDAAAGTL